MMGPPPGRGRGRGRGTPLRPSSALGLVGGAGKDGGSTRKASLLPPRPISAMGSAGDRPFSAKEKANSIPVAWGEEPKQGENQAVQENSVERKGRITRMRANEGETRPFSAIGVTGRRSASPVVGSAGSALRKRPTSALASFSGFALNQPLHPREVLGRGLGTNIGISDKSAEVFADRQLVRRTHTLAQDLMTLSRVASAPIVEQVSQVEEPEEDDAPATWEMEGGEKRVRNITDLTPIEMAELESRFKHDGEDGLAQDEFEEVMAEFTGMQGNMSSQLFCKIDANDDGSVEWDEFLSYIVHEAGARLEDAKAKPGASIEGGVLPAQMAQPKDMVGALCLLGRHRLLATVGMVRRELVFWNLDTYSKVKEVLVPSATEALQYRGRGGMVEVKVTELKAPPQTIAPPKTVAGRSMAYLPSNQGLLYACTGTDSMILQFDCRRFRVREIVIPPFTPSCLCVAWNPGVSRSVSHVEQGSWLLVGDVNGDVACLNCKTHELVGRYHAHDRSVQLGQGSLVNQVLLWPKVGVISCGDDGRVVVADYEFWKIKDYFSDEHLKIVELVLSVVSDAKTKAEQADDASAAHALAQRKLEQFETSGARLAQSSISSSRKNRKGSVVSEKSGPIAFDKLKETVEEAERLVALRKSIAQTRSRMAMELLGGSGGAVGSKAVARGLGGDGALGVVEEAGEGVPGRSEKRGGGAGSRQVEAVLTENADIAKCFEGLGWNRKTKQFDSHPQWALLHSRLDVLRSNLLKEAERKKRPMVLTTGASQTCVAISEKHRSIIAGGKDRIVRIWNPFLSLESLGVEELHGHEARIIQLVVMERQNVLVSAAVDKWMRVWDMTTFQVLQKLYDQFDHRPVDRITSMCHDEINQRIITFGNRARVWRVQERTLQDVAAVVRKGTGLQKKGTKAISSAKDGDGVYEQLEESGWSVVDVRQVAQKLQKEYGAGDVWDVPKNIKLLIGTENDADQGEEEVENSKWLELQAQLDHARATGCKQLVVAVCYSSVFHQLVQVGVHHCTVRNMVNGAQVCRFAISRGHPVTTATLDQSERRLFTGAHDGSVRSWNFNSGVLLCEFSKLNKEITSLLFLQTRRFIHRPLVGAGWDKNVVMWADSADDDAEKLEIKGHTADILCLAVCDRVDNGGREIGARGTLVVSGDSEGTVCFWVASNGRLDHSFSPRFLNPDRDHNIDIDHQKDPDAVNHDSVFSLLHIKGTDTLLVGVGSGEIHVIDVQTCVKQKTIVPEAFQHDSRDNPTENPITAATNANELSLFPQPDPPSSLALDTTGNKLLVGGASGAVQMLRVKSKRPFEITRIRRFQAHWGAVLSIVCSPQSHLWVTSGGDGSSRVWNRYGKPVAVVGDRKAEENWPLWLDPLFSKDPAADQSGKNMARKVSGEGGASVSVQGAEGRTASKAAAGARMSEVEEIPFHIRCPPFIPKTLFSKTDSAHQALAKINEANAREEEEQEEADRDRGEDAEDGGDEDRAGGRGKRMPLRSILDGMYSEACLEVSLAEKKKMADLDKWLSDLMTGTPAFPKSVNLYDILPQGKTPNVMAQRTEDLCLVIEALNKHRVMIKDSFRTYASLALTQVNSLDTMSVTEMRVFLKDNRCSQRVLSKLNGIFSISNRIEKAPDPSAKADATEPGAGELVLAEFLECLVRLAREQIPGKDHLPKKVSLFLQAMARHSKVAARDAAQVSANSEVQKVLKKQHPLLVKVYQKYCSQDRTDDKLATMNLKELFQLMKDCQQMDTKFSISKLASAFIAANACAEAGDDGTWNDWDWELSFDEFIEALVRIVDMKTKTHEGALSEKLEYFIQHSIAKYCL